MATFLIISEFTIVRTIRDGGSVGRCINAQSRTHTHTHTNLFQNRFGFREDVAGIRSNRIVGCRIIEMESWLEKQKPVDLWKLIDCCEVPD